MKEPRINSETLVNACSNNSCSYNKLNFCQIPSVMLDDEGKCIYANKNKEDSNGTS